MSSSVMEKALQSSRQAAQLRLEQGACALQEKLLQSWELSRVKNKTEKHQQVVLLWPGVLQEVDTSTDEVLSRTHAADMHWLRPEAARLIVDRAKGRPLLSTVFRTTNGCQLRAVVDANAIVRIEHVRSKKVLAISEPGDPNKLSAQFHPLKLEDLLPRYR